MPLLDVQEIEVRFGGIVALDGLSFTVEKGQICVSRLYQPFSGHIGFDGRDLLALPPHGIARVGVARTFQNLALFPALSVVENVMVGAHTNGKVGFGRALLRLGVGKEEKKLRAECTAILERMSLGHLTNRPAVGLPFGTLKRIEFARAVAATPSRRSATSSTSPCCWWSTT